MSADSSRRAGRGSTWVRGERSEPGGRGSTWVSPRLVDPDAGIGIVAPHDLALDRELWRWVPDDVALYITRLPCVDRPVGVDMAEAVADHTLVARACGEVSAPAPAVTAFLCTSGSFVGGIRGEVALRHAMETGGATRAVTTSGALLDALDALGVTRVGVGTPYDLALTAGLVDFLSEAGHEAVAVAHLGLETDIARVSPDSVRDLARAVAHGDAEAIFLSCTNLPTVDVLADLERALDRPVLSANLVTMWQASRLLGRLPQRPERLFHAHR